MNLINLINLVDLVDPKIMDICLPGAPDASEDPALPGPQGLWQSPLVHLCE